MDSEELSKFIKAAGENNVAFLSQDKAKLKQAIEASYDNPFSLLDMAYKARSVGATLVIAAQGGLPKTIGFDSIDPRESEEKKETAELRATEIFAHAFIGYKENFEEKENDSPQNFFARTMHKIIANKKDEIKKEYILHPDVEQFVNSEGFLDFFKSFSPRSDAHMGRHLYFMILSMGNESTIAGKLIPGLLSLITQTRSERLSP